MMKALDKLKTVYECLKISVLDCINLYLNNFLFNVT